MTWPPPSPCAPATPLWVDAGASGVALTDFTQTRRYGKTPALRGLPRPQSQGPGQEPPVRQGTTSRRATRLSDHNSTDQSDPQGPVLQRPALLPTPRGPTPHVYVFES